MDETKSQEAAMAAGCPHAQKATTNKEESCGFNARLMESAKHASGFVINSSSSSSYASLSKDRVVSSIPKGDYTPSHQTKDKQNWEYPSEEMYFHAMKKKGWDPEANQMGTIVAIHNSVNEQSWKEVLKWESYHPTQKTIKLKRFMGKPTEYSPKARLMHLLGWSVLPFDRHDWIVDRDGQEVRYVIDFYSGQPETGRPLSIYLDVRPALDSFENAMDRLKWQFREHIQPLLPFRGAFLNQNKEEEEQQKQQQEHKNSTVVTSDA